MASLTRPIDRPADLRRMTPAQLAVAMADPTAQRRRLVIRYSPERARMMRRKRVEAARAMLSEYRLRARWRAEMHPPRAPRALPRTRAPGRRTRRATRVAAAASTRDGPPSPEPPRSRTARAGVSAGTEGGAPW